MIRPDHHVGRSFVFLPALLHQIRNKIYIFVPVEQRTVIAVLYPFVDRLGACSQKDDPAVLLHLRHILFPQRHTAAA